MKLHELLASPYVARLPRSPTSRLAVCVFTMRDLQHGNDDSTSIDTVQDPMSTDSNTIDIVVPLKLATPEWPGIVSECLNRPEHAQAVVASEFLELPLSGSRDFDSITCHPARGL